MLKVMFQDKNGNAPIQAAFCSFRESRGIMAQTLADLKAQGVRIIESDSQHIVTEKGKFWLS